MTPFLSTAIAEMLPDADPVDGCRECGFTWTIDAEAARTHLGAAAVRFAALLADAQDGAATRASRSGTWSPSAYVWHVGDVVRAWSERLHALGQDPTVRWVGFDPDELARARHYDALPPVTGPWALGQAVAALDHVLATVAPDTPFTHPEWGHGTVTDALRWLAHEVVHHDLDVQRGLARAAGEATG